MLTRAHNNRRFLPTLERVEPVILDHSATKIYMECPRKYFYRIVLGRTLEDNKLKVIFDWGSAIHKFAECIYKGEGFQKAFSEALKVYTPPSQNTPDRWNHLDTLRFGQTCKAIWEFYQKEMNDSRFAVEGVEQPFNLQLPESERVGGRFDMLFTRNGRLLVRDWKTTTKRTDYFTLGLNPNDQATRYCYAASTLSGWNSSSPTKNKIDGIEYIIVENQKPTKSTNHPPKVSAHFVNKTADDLMTWEREMVHLYKQMEFNRAADVWPQSPLNCGWCDYVHVCRHPTDSGRAYKLKSEFKFSPWDHQKVDQEAKAE